MEYFGRDVPRNDPFSAVDDNYDSLRECNYSRRERGLPQLIASCRAIAG